VARFGAAAPVYVWKVGHWVSSADASQPILAATVRCQVHLSSQSGRRQEIQPVEESVR